MNETVDWCKTKYLLFFAVAVQSYMEKYLISSFKIFLKYLDKFAFQEGFLQLKIHI